MNRLLDHATTQAQYNLLRSIYFEGEPQLWTEPIRDRRAERIAAIACAVGLVVCALYGAVTAFLHR